MQYFPSDELIKSIIKTGSTTLQLPMGSNLRVGGLSYNIMTNLNLDLTSSGTSGLDTGVATNDTEYYIFVVLSGGFLFLVASLNAQQPFGFDAYRRIGKIETDGTGDITIINADLINTVQQSQIETINLNIAENTNNIEALQGQLSNQSSGLDEVVDDVGVLQSAVSSLQLSSSAHADDIVQLQTDVGTLDSTVSTQTVSIGNLQTVTGSHTSSISSLSTQVSVQSTDISNLQDTTTNHGSRLTSLEAEFDDEFGHRHDGVDSPRIKALDLDASEAVEGDTLVVDENLELAWVPFAPPAQAAEPKEYISIKWVEGTVNSPIKQTQLSGSALAYDYFSMGEGGNGQRLYASFVVPPSHIAGNKISFSLSDYTSGNTGDTRQYACTSYLIKGSSPVDSTASSHLSTGSVLSASATPNLKVSQVFDITDANGQIASQNAEAGDLIHIAIEKLDTGETEDAAGSSVLYNGATVVFNIN